MPHTRVLWATTRAGRTKVDIYVNPDLDAATYGLTEHFAGRIDVELNPRIMHKRQLLFKTLVHEFVHVVEYANDPGYLSPERVDECTMLAQVMEAQLAPLLLNVNIVRPWTKEDAAVSKAPKPARRVRKKRRGTQ